MSFNVGSESLLSLSTVESLWISLPASTSTNIDNNRSQIQPSSKITLTPDDSKISYDEDDLLFTSNPSGNNVEMEDTLSDDGLLSANITDCATSESEGRWIIPGIANVSIVTQRDLGTQRNSLTSSTKPIFDDDHFETKSHNNSDRGFHGTTAVQNGADVSFVYDSSLLSPTVTLNKSEVVEISSFNENQPLEFLTFPNTIHDSEKDCSFISSSLSDYGSDTEVSILTETCTPKYSFSESNWGRFFSRTKQILSRPAEIQTQHHYNHPQSNLSDESILTESSRTSSYSLSEYDDDSQKRAISSRVMTCLGVVVSISVVIASILLAETFPVSSRRKEKHEASNRAL